MRQLMRGDIVLLGPMCAGKTTIAKRLSRAAGIAHLNIDQCKFKYFESIGYCDQDAEYCYKKDGIRGLYNYNKPFELNALRNFLCINSNCIFDLGAGFVEYEDSEMQKEAFDLLAAFSNVILLLPQSNIQKSCESLKARFAKRYDVDKGLKDIMLSTPGFDLNDYLIDFFYQNKSKFKVVYTRHKSVKKIISDVIKVLT
jgi:shikimate kinase